MMKTRQQLRTELKQRRSQCSMTQCQHDSLRICDALYRTNLYRNAKRIAFYYPTGKEVNLLPLIEHAWTQQKQVFLPVLAQFPQSRLWWIPYSPDTPCYLNQFGIPEPHHNKQTRRTKLRSLNMILMPLVGFDQAGNRLGMGGGYYDRSLAHLPRHMTSWQRPLKIGIAYSWQQVDSIPHEKWDIPLDAVVTETGLTWFRSH